MQMLWLRESLIIALVAGMIIPALPRSWVSVRVKRVLAWVYIALFALVLVQSLRSDPPTYLLTGLGGIVTFVGAQLMFTDLPTRRTAGRVLLWIGLAVLVLGGAASNHPMPHAAPAPKSGQP